jgi:nucleoid-associated protein YgaU
VTDIGRSLPLAGPPEPGYPLNSRYAATGTVTRTLPDGRTVTFLARRIVPGTEESVIDSEHEVEPLDRLDQLAATTWGDSRLWWRIADANGAVDPDDLLEPGNRLGMPRPGTLGASGPSALGGGR